MPEPYYPTQSEQWAASAWKRLALDPPADLQAVCDHLGIRVGKPVLPNDLLGIYIRLADGSQSIKVNGGLPIAQRPAARRMLEDARAGRFEGIIAKQQDRIGRNAADSIAFPEVCKKAGITLLFAQESYADTPAGRLNYNILASLAQYYREDIGAKIRDHNVWVAQQGRWCGGTAPFGYRYNQESKRLEPDPDRAGDLVTLFRVYVECSGAREGTAKRLNALGIPGPQGTHWAAIRVKRIIANPVYDGRIRYGGREYPTDQVPKIVPDELVAEARRLFELTRGTRPTSRNRVYPYSQVLWCGLCGTRMWVCGPGDPSRGITPQYRCVAWIKYRQCDAPGIAESRLDKLIVPRLADVIRLHQAEIVEEMLRIREADPEAARPRRTPESLSAARERVLDAYADGLIDRELFEKKLSQIDDRLRELQTSEIPRRFNLDPDLAERITSDVAELWHELLPDEKRALLMTLTPRIVVIAGRIARATIHSPLLTHPLTATNEHYRGRL